MSFTKFYLDVLESLNKQKVEYMLVGGHAVNYYGYVRATLDMDIWVDTDDKNLLKLEQALVNLGYAAKSCHEAVVYLKQNHIFKIPKENVLIDIMDSFIIKHDFKASLALCEQTAIDGVSITVIGFDDLIEIKQQSNRPKDLLDAQELITLKHLQQQQESTAKLINEKIKKKK